jgi:hypothetical protein
MRPADAALFQSAPERLDASSAIPNPMHQDDWSMRHLVLSFRWIKCATRPGIYSRPVGHLRRYVCRPSLTTAARTRKVTTANT